MVYDEMEHYRWVRNRVSWGLAGVLAAFAVVRYLPPRDDNSFSPELSVREMENVKFWQNRNLDGYYEPAEIRSPQFEEGTYKTEDLGPRIPDY